MVSTLLAATLLAAPTPPAPPSSPTPPSPPSAPSVTDAKPTKRAKPPKPSPEERLAKLDQARLELHFGLRGYGRFLAAEPAYGGSFQLGAGVRLVRGLYLTGEIGAGAHAMPFGAAGQVLVGLRHELRMSRWVRPSFSLAYSHLVDVSFDGAFNAECGCLDFYDYDYDYDHGGGVSGRGEVEIDQRSGVQAGLGLRFPMRWAPRLSVYARGDAAYYFDGKPGRLQAGVGGGLQIVF